MKLLHKEAGLLFTPLESILERTDYAKVHVEGIVQSSEELEQYLESERAHIDINLVIRSGSLLMVPVWGAWAQAKDL